ncbi:hypothetical protein N7G274_006634 [Stereocaulon virgatum]|uniref:Uncharacterized protein n=1 Tax=Stereocaulon virgatum TaxID=373712 RepID=A0ABR4A491_9LECA
MGSDTVCYREDGTVPLDVPCAFSPISICCAADWKCTTNGLCQNPRTLEYAQGTCTDPTYKNCLSICNHRRFYGYKKVIHCISNGNSWCCAGPSGSADCCTANLITTLEPYPPYILESNLATATAALSTYTSDPTFPVFFSPPSLVSSVDPTVSASISSLSPISFVDPTVSASISSPSPFSFVDPTVSAFISSSSPTSSVDPTVSASISSSSPISFVDPTVSASISFPSPFSFVDPTVSAFISSSSPTSSVDPTVSASISSSSPTSSVVPTAHNDAGVATSPVAPQSTSENHDPSRNIDFAVPTVTAVLVIAIIAFFILRNRRPKQHHLQGQNERVRNPPSHRDVESRFQALERPHNTIVHPAGLEYEAVPSKIRELSEFPTQLA